MNIPATTAILALLASVPAFADSHLSELATYGEAEFGQCGTCHMIADDEGTILAGKRVKSGPNLYCMIGRQAGTVEGFRYGKDLVAAGEAGLVWTEDALAEYLLDPRKYLQNVLDNPKARSRMSFKARKDGDLSPEDVAARMAAFVAEICGDGEGS